MRGAEYAEACAPVNGVLRRAVQAAVAAYAASGRMLDAALVYAEHDLPVFPLDVKTKAPIPPRDGKTKENPKGIPGTGGHKKATCDPLTIRRWWRRNPDALIGMPMGERTGIWCLDVDTDEDHADGVAAWTALAVEHEPIITREHRSATGGPHLIFNWSADKPIRTGRGKLPKDGISVKGEGGYIVVPPSRRKGRTYTVFDDIDPDHAPGWLVDEILQERTREYRASSRVEAPANINEIAEAMSFVPNDDLSWEEWTSWGLAIFAATGGQGLDVFDAFSRRSSKYDAVTTDKRWEEITGSPPNRTGKGKIFKEARRHGWKRTAKPTYAAATFADVEHGRDRIGDVLGAFFDELDLYQQEEERGDPYRHAFRPNPFLVHGYSVITDRGWEVPPRAWAARVTTGVGQDAAHH